MTYKELYPGMLDSSKEYFEAEDEIFLISNGTVKNFDDLDIPVVCHNMKPFRLKYNQVCELLNVTRDCLRKIIENDLSFPRPLKECSTRQAAVYFDTAEIEEWYKTYKAKCRSE